MRKIYCFLFLFFAAFSMQSQELLSEIDDVHPADFIDAKFNGGGLDKFYEFVNKEIDKSKMTKPGKLVFAFTISETGDLKNIKVVEFPDVVMATEIIRVLKLTPKWEPAKRGGKPVSITIKFPITYSERNKN